MIAITVFAFTLGWIKTIRDTQSVVTSAVPKKLPIYCMDTQSKKYAAIVFDILRVGDIRKSGT